MEYGGVEGICFDINFRLIGWLPNLHGTFSFAFVKLSLICIDIAVDKSI